MSLAAPDAGVPFAVVTQFDPSSDVQIDHVAFGAIGFMIRTPDEIAPMLKKAMNCVGPVIVGVQVDYSDNAKLFEKLDQNSIH